MMALSSPRSLAAIQLQELFQHFPGVRDGLPESVHQARVATRRLREVVPLMADGRGGDLDAALSQLRSMGRQLGRVRELDVMHEALGREEERVPAFAAAIAVARRGLASRHLAARRHMIKALEELDPEHLRDALSTHFGRWDRLRDRYVSGAWTATLRETIAGHAAAVGSAVAHAAGVYFPNRSHAVRISVKRLRYSVEVAAATGLWPAARLLRDVKRIQVTLGELHDIQVLADTVEDLVGDSIVRLELPALIAALHAEAEQIHRQYVARRERLLAIAAASERFAGRVVAVRRWRGARTSLVAASSLAVPTGLLLLGLSHRHRDVVPPEQASLARGARF